MNESQLTEFFDYDAFTRARNSLDLRKKKLDPEALRLLSEEVISRLAKRYSKADAKADIPSSEEVDTLCTTLLSSDPDAASDYILGLRAAGKPTETIYMDYIAEAARRLGQWWEEERVSFTDVTIGAGRLYIIMRALRPPHYGVSSSSRRNPVLFASTPGETHTLGISMAADLFRDRGWEIDLRTGLDHDEIVQATVERQYAIIGVGASSQRMLFPLTRLIASFRISSPISSILVSGPLAGLEPQLKELVDADCVAMDAPTAIRAMDRMDSEIEARSSRASNSSH